MAEISVELFWVGVLRFMSWDSLDYFEMGKGILRASYPEDYSIRLSLRVLLVYPSSAISGAPQQLISFLKKPDIDNLEILL